MKNTVKVLRILAKSASNCILCGTSNYVSPSQRAHFF